MRHLGYVVWPVLALATLAACSNPLEPEQHALSVARARWADAGIESYVFELRRICFCGPDYTDPLRVEVVEGAVVSVVYVDTGEPVPDELETIPTIESLFDAVQDAINREAYSLDVQYDEDLGYPLDIAIDYSPNIADEERGWIVSALDPST